MSPPLFFSLPFTSFTPKLCLVRVPCRQCFFRIYLYGIDNGSSIGSKEQRRVLEKCWNLPRSSDEKVSNTQTDETPL